MRKISFSVLLTSVLAVSATSFTAVSTTGCGGDGGGGGGGGGGAGDQACFDYSKFDGESPTVSFKTEVFPIFRRSCGITTGCHGDPNQPDEKRPYLGPKQSDNLSEDEVNEAVAIIRGAIIDVPAYFEPGMSIVAAGDPENSFLLHKMDFTLQCDALQCAETKDCGTPMPQGNEEPLDQAERDLIRRWIAQGALDN